jgi:AcrR family transcriptional regulator
MSPKITQEQKDENRRKILLAARRVFERLGYKTATMKDVVEESGMSRGGVYLYFGSTEEMLHAILEQIDEQDEAYFTQALAGRGAAWQALEAFLAQMGVAQEAEALTVALLEYYLENSWDEEKRTNQARRYERVVAFVQAFLQKGTERGEFAPLLPTETIARMFVSINEGVHLDRLIIGAQALRVDDQVAGFTVVLRHLLQVQDRDEARGAGHEGAV